MIAPHFMYKPARPSSVLKFSELRIAVLEGGPGSEREVSLRSGANVAGWLQQAGAAQVIRVDVQDENFLLPSDTDLAFNSIHGVLGEDGVLQKILEHRAILYTGEGVRGSELAFDKILTKKRLDERGIDSPAYEVIAVDQLPTLPLPFVVKAPCQGSSVGVHLVRDADGIAPAMRDVAKYGDQALIERLISGQELTVGIVGDLALPIVMIKPKQDFYDFKNKYPWLNPAGAADHFCPAPLAERLTAQIQELSLAAHRALGLETYSRVDLLMDADQRPYVIEINTIPGMTESSLLPEAGRAIGMEPPELCRRIVELSLARQNVSLL